MSREQPHLPGLHEKGTQGAENNLTCTQAWQQQWEPWGKKHRFFGCCKSVCWATPRSFWLVNNQTWGVTFQLEAGTLLAAPFFVFPKHCLVNHFFTFLSSVFNLTTESLSGMAADCWTVGKLSARTVDNIIEFQKISSQASMTNQPNEYLTQESVLKRQNSNLQQRKLNYLPWVKSNPTVLMHLK